MVARSDRQYIHKPQGESAAVRIALHGRKHACTRARDGRLSKIFGRAEEIERARRRARVVTRKRHLDMILFFAEPFYLRHGGARDTEPRFRISRPKRRKAGNVFCEAARTLRAV